MITQRYIDWERSREQPHGSAAQWDRFEWRVGDPGDPAALIRDALAAWGLGLHRTGTDARADVFVSAAGGAAMIGAPTGPPSPIPAIPDIVVAVHGPDPAHRPVPPPDPTWALGPWRPSWTPAEHAGAVESVRDAIARGDVYQVNVVGHASAALRGDPRPALHRLTGLPGARYGGLLTGAGWALASASPELLVRAGGGRVETRPIKGTRPATAAGRRELRGSAKERAEHVMIVDLERNDLARVALIGSVVVPELFAVRRWCDLWQAESRVTARLRPDVDVADLLRAVCPGGSVTGAPKLAALAQVARLEPVGRGPSMGALGRVTDGLVELGLTIRTAAADADRLHVWAGGGIVWDSDPYAEVAEAAQKSAPLRTALTPHP